MTKLTAGDPEVDVDEPGRRGFLRDAGAGVASAWAWLRGARAEAATPGQGGAAGQARVARSDPALQRVFEAAHKTLLNCAQETCVDGMGRERQQYSGDCVHQLHAIRYLYGERRLPRRFFRTYAMGESQDGYWLDAWPAYDRLNRIAQRQVGATIWGPMLDHIVQFILDNWLHYQETAEEDVVRASWPRLARFADYLLRFRGADGLLPAADMGTPSIWIDQDVCYPTQRQRQLPFNLFTAGIFAHALAPMAALVGERRRQRQYAAAAEGLLAAAVERFWDPARGLFVNNLPWQREDGGPRLCDRSLVMALLWDQYPGGRVRGAIDTLVARPPELGIFVPVERVLAILGAGAARAHRRRPARPSRALGNHAFRAAQQHRSARSGRRRRTPPRSGATPPSFRSTRCSWTSPASARRPRASRRSRSARSSATSTPSS